jgi:hypothetical protein
LIRRAIYLGLDPSRRCRRPVSPVLHVGARRLRWFARARVRCLGWTRQAGRVSMRPFVTLSCHTNREFTEIGLHRNGSRRTSGYSGLCRIGFRHNRPPTATVTAHSPSDFGTSRWRLVTRLHHLAVRKKDGTRSRGGASGSRCLVAISSAVPPGSHRFRRRKRLAIDLAMAGQESPVFLA